MARDEQTLARLMLVPAKVGCGCPWPCSGLFRLHMGGCGCLEQITLSFSSSRQVQAKTNVAAFVAALKQMYGVQAW